MNAPPENDLAVDTPRCRSRARRELIIAGVALAFGLFALPALVYVVGGMVMGPYGENKGLGSFYGDFFRDLVEPAGRAWALALGPLVLVTAIRAVFIGVKRPEPREAEQHPEDAPRRRRPEEPHRVEPRVTLD